MMSGDRCPLLARLIVREWKNERSQLAAGYGQERRGLTHNWMVGSALTPYPQVNGWGSRQGGQD